MSLKKQVLLCCLSLLFISGTFYFVITQHQPPKVAAIDAPAVEFSAARAMQQLNKIAQAPHPVGSPDHAEVRDYITGVLRDLECTPEIQTSEIITSEGAEAMNLYNIVARIKGEGADGKAIMLTAHYDSVPQSYGASDNGSGVVTVLETIRALKSGGSLRNDIIALFTDAEEIGLLGANAFVRQHEWSKSVEIILNFEARGTRGPVFMFETSDRNGTLIREFARAAPFPFASSLSQGIYRILPNQTDLTVFKRAGYKGFNFAHIDGVRDYHTLRDNTENVSAQSVQHHGSYALALARHFGNMKLDKLQAENVVYFDVLGKAVISYSNSAAQALTICNIGIFIAILVYGLKKNSLSLSAVLQGVPAYFLSLIGTVLIVMLATALSGVKFNNQEAPGLDHLVFLSLVALAILVLSSVYLYFNRSSDLDSLSYGTLGIHLLLSAVITMYFTEASYLLAWPLLSILLVFAVKVTPYGMRMGQLMEFTVLCLFALPAIILSEWTTLGVFQAVGLNYPVTLMIVVFVLVSFFLPFLKYLSRPFKRLVPVVSATVAAIVLGIALSLGSMNHAASIGPLSPRENVHVTHA
jgi:hypothetical protein